MVMAGYLASILIGVSLGVIGGGGSILTVPLLVYLFGIDPVLSITYSLFVVGLSSIAGSVSYFKRKLINVRIAFFFGIPSIAAVLLTRTYIVPAIPRNVFEFGSFTLTKDILLMLFFAIVMIIASFSMIKKSRSNKPVTAAQNASVLVIFLQGAGVGIVTGLIGAGGGFLIIPALVNGLRLPMKTAIGTSLVIIGINSLTGFFFSPDHRNIDWQFLLTVASFAIGGILAGSFLSTNIDGKKLKPVFGWFVLTMGIYIILKETILK